MQQLGGGVGARVEPVFVVLAQVGEALRDVGDGPVVGAAGAPEILVGVRLAAARGQDARGLREGAGEDERSNNMHYGNVQHIPISIDGG